MERNEKDLETLELFSKAVKEIHKEVEKVIVGQKEIINQLLVALFSRGNCLLIGVPGLAKTLMIRTLASAMDLKFSRIQFTPDLMPS
ncbi:MAG: AAA family ATPase, partial [Candidatus Kapaibacteriota bacterium]